MVKLTLNILVLSLLLCLATADNPPSTSHRLKICTQPSDYGSCRDMQQRWYFNSEYNKCNTFFYSGCGGNSNQFYWESECMNYCLSPDYSYDM